MRSRARSDQSIVGVLGQHDRIREGTIHNTRRLDLENPVVNRLPLD